MSLRPSLRMTALHCVTWCPFWPSPVVPDHIDSLMEPLLDSVRAEFIFRSPALFGSICCAFLDVLSCLVTLHVAQHLFGSAACPILYFTKVKQQCWSAEELCASFYFCEESESGERGYFSCSSGESGSFFGVSKEHIVSTLQNLTCQDGVEVGRYFVWRRMEDAAPAQGWCFSRKSLWLFFVLARRPRVLLITGRPHGFFWFTASFLLPRLFAPSFHISVSLLPSFVLCVGLWSLKVLENEWASNNSRPGSSVGPFGSQPIVPFSIWWTAPGMDLHAASRLHLIKPALIVKDGEVN